MRPGGVRMQCLGGVVRASSMMQAVYRRLQRRGDAKAKALRWRAHRARRQCHPARNGAGQVRPSIDLELDRDQSDRLHRYVAFHLASHALRGQLQTIAMRCPDLDEVLRRRERWVTATAAEVAGEALDASVLAAVVTGLVEVAVPDPDARVVLDHAVARLVGRRRRRTA